MSAPVLEEELTEGILTLWLNRPQKRNALNGALVEALHAALERARSLSEVRVVVLRGRGPDFCAGADLEELEKAAGQSPEESLADARRLGALLLALRKFPRPVVAAVHGRALAGGLGLATACDLLVAQEGSEMGYPEIHLGFVPAMVMAILRRKVPEGKAFELVTLGGRISAAEAQALGLVSRVFSASRFDEELRSFVLDLARRPPGALALVKALLYEQGDLPLAEGIERGAEVNVQARRSPECREGVRRFLGGRRNVPSQ